MDISYGETNFNDANREMFQQKYSLNWSKNLFSQLSLRSSYRYSKSDLSQNSSNSILQEEQQPSFDLIWNNPDFTLSSSNSYRTTNATITKLQLSRKSWTIFFRSKSIKYPILSLRFNRDHLYNNKNISIQNMFEQRHQAEIHQSFKNNNFQYSFTRRYNENRTNDFKTTNYVHVLYLSDIRKTNNKKFSFSSNYSMTYQKQIDERPNDTTDYFILQVLYGIYVQTNNYTLDSLLHVRALKDGNDQERVIPLIDIGGTSVNQNIGVDFGYEQKVSALYLYVDQFSDKQMFDVYVSNDNLSWELHSVSADIIFNSGYNRFEIIFPEVLTRYIKVVNLDISDIEHAYVTEIQALEQRAVSEFTELNSSSHLVDLNSQYKHSENISYMFDMSYQHLPGQFGNKNRDNVSYSISNRIKQTDKISHNLRWQHNVQYFHGAALDITNFGLNYLLNFVPLEKLEFTLSSNMQLDYIGGMKNTKNSSILFNSRGTPLADINMSIELTYSRNNQYISETIFDSWNQRVSFDGSISRTLTMISSFSHRYTKAITTDSTNTAPLKTNRNQYQLGLRYRFTKTIFLRGSFNINKSTTTYYSQDYMISWNPSRKLSISSQIKHQDDNNLTITKRYNTQLNYKVSRNANIYLSYMLTDLTQADGQKNKSIRAGFRSGL